jgi:3-oxoacyl-[acyl-carrier protein] reductase
MDLGIKGKSAIVCAASKGLGRACAWSLAREGVSLTICARGGEDLDRTAAEIRKQFGVPVDTVAVDITTPEGRARVLAACPQPDILVNNAGGPPPGDFRKWTREDWLKAIDANMLTPIELIKATVDHMIARRFGRIVNITSSAVKSPIAPLGLSNGARTGLTGFVAGIARQIARHNVTINNLLPGAFDTDRLRSTMAALAKDKNLSLEEAKAERAQGIPAGRLGDPAEFGEACAYLCSAQAGYVTGQNFLIDGGAYPGTF